MCVRELSTVYDVGMGRGKDGGGGECSMVLGVFR